MSAPAVVAARALVRHLAALGVRQVVLAPGSRSAPLAYALVEADDAGLIELHVRIDERSAGFLALGMARGHEPEGDSMPVAVATTSGTAVANLHPAVLEAHHAGVPLIVLTADRPAELRGTGANQTTDQLTVFGPALRRLADVPAPDGRPGEVDALLDQATRAVRLARGAHTRNPGPVQINLQYRPPLVPVTDPGVPSTDAHLERTPGSALQDPASASDAAGRARGGVRGADAERIDVSGASASRVDVRSAVGALGAAAEPFVPAERTVVVAGDGAGRVAGLLAAARGWPLLAEPSANPGEGPAIPGYPFLLDAGLGSDVEEAIVLGRPTLSRPVQALLARPDVRVTVVCARPEWPDPPGGAARVLADVPDTWLAPAGGSKLAPAPGSDWLDRWRRAGDAVAGVLRAATGGPGLDGFTVARAVAAACNPEDVLVVGSSSPIRDLDLVLGVDAGARPVILANRGLAGIDGTVSTALGVAAGAVGRRVRALLGDLTFLHDVGGLLRGPLEPGIQAQLVVVNDDGGAIFSTLEPGDLAATSRRAAAAFERVFATPHGVRIEQLCSAYGIRHVAVTDTAELRAALAEPAHGVQVVEARVDREQRRVATEALRGRIASCLS